MLHSLHVAVKLSFLIHYNEIAWPFASGLSSYSSLKCPFPIFTQLYESVSTGTHKHVNQYLLALYLNIDIMQKKNTCPGKKVQKALQPSKKKASHRKKAQKRTTVLLKALATIPKEENTALLKTCPSECHCKLLLPLQHN